MQPSVTTHTKLTISTHCYLYYSSAKLPGAWEGLNWLGVCTSSTRHGHALVLFHLYTWNSWALSGTAFHIFCGAISECGYKYLEVKENGRQPCESPYLSVNDWLSMVKGTVIVLSTGRNLEPPTPQVGWRACEDFPAGMGTILDVGSTVAWAGPWTKWKGEKVVSGDPALTPRFSSSCGCNVASCLELLCPDFTPWWATKPQAGTIPFPFNLRETKKTDGQCCNFYWQKCIYLVCNRHAPHNDASVDEGHKDNSGPMRLKWSWKLLRWHACEMSPTGQRGWTLASHPVAVGKVLNPLGGGALVEVGHWAQASKFYSL